jgi:tRNA threonylcarbamoyladenosine biosynthesis protein TsaB
MRILAIESSAVTASVAILTDDVLTAEYTVNYKKTHSQTLLPMIDEICKMTESQPETIDIIAVSAGPGSFTGLRIGAATGKGMALALDKKMVAVPTLAALAYNVYGTDKLICPIMDARRQHLYTAAYRFADDELVNVIEPSLLSYEELAEKLNVLGESVIFVGDGISVAKTALDEQLTCEYSYAPANIRTQRASGVALAALKMYENGEAISAAELKPEYLRPSQAERERNEKL